MNRAAPGGSLSIQAGGYTKPMCGSGVEESVRTPRRLVVVALLAALGVGCGSAPKVDANDAAKAPRVAVVKPVRKELSSTLEIAAEFQPFQEIDVYAKVSGYIQKLNVDWGTHVGQGQLLAVLEIPELQQQLQLDEAAVRRSEQDLARAKEELSRAQSTYNVTHLTYTRLADVQKARPELVAQEEIDEAQGKIWRQTPGVSSAKDAVAGSEQALMGIQSATRKGQGPVRLCAHNGSVRWRGDQNRRLYRGTAAGRNFLQ